MSTKLHLSGAGTWNEIVVYASRKGLRNVGRLVSYWDLGTKGPRDRFSDLLGMVREDKHESESSKAPE